MGLAVGSVAVFPCAAGVMFISNPGSSPKHRKSVGQRLLKFGIKRALSWIRGGYDL